MTDFLIGQFENFYFISLCLSKKKSIIFFYQIFQEVMSRKIKHQQYEVLVNFKSDNCLSISAQFMPTGEHFINNGAELMRINKQTVLASLERKSEKHLKCQFEQIVEDGKKQLIIVFIVNFDFLPEFKEQVRLEYVQQKESLKGLNLINMQAQIAQMQKALDSMNQSGSSTIHNETTVTLSLNDKKQIWSYEVAQGKYIVRCSGTINNPTGIQSSEKLNIYLCPPGEDKQVKPIQIKTYHQSGYHYPFFVSGLLDCKEGVMKIQMTSSVANSSAMNVHVVVNHVVQAA